MASSLVFGDKFSLAIYPGLKSLTYLLKSFKIRKTNVKIFISTCVFDSEFEVI